MKGTNFLIAGTILVGYLIGKRLLKTHGWVSSSYHLSEMAGVMPDNWGDPVSLPASFFPEFSMAQIAMAESSPD